MKYLIVLILVSCGLDQESLFRQESFETDPVYRREVQTQQVLENINIMKSLDQSENLSLEDSTKLDFHVLSKSKTVLLRHLDFLDHRDMILTSSESEQVYLDIKYLNEEVEPLVNEPILKLCLINQDWSYMFSNWSKSSRSSSWLNPGGSSSSCVESVSFDKVFMEDDSVYHREQYNDKEDRLVFNITQFVQSQVLGAGKNYGWVLNNSFDKEVKIYGLSDDNKINGPRVYWKEIIE